MIHELNQEGKVTLTCLIARAEIGRSSKNVPYLTLSLQDKSGTLDARYWNLSEEEAKAWKEGQVVEVQGDLKRYRNAWQLRIFSLSEVEGDAVDYVPSAPLDTEELKAEIYGLIAEITNPIIRAVSEKLLMDNEKDYFTYPAAVRNHHNFPGGLAWHSLSMARLAKSVLAQYPWLDYDLLISGVLLHDLSKIEEYTAAVLPEYSAAGNLIGHISMGSEQIDRAAVELGVSQSEEVMLMKHMLLSHHGKHEYGSPVLPMIPEAEALTILDNLDSRLFMIQASVEQVAPGCFGPRSFALDNRMFYRKSWDDENNRPVPCKLEVNPEQREETEQKTETKPEETPDNKPSAKQADQADHPVEKRADQPAEKPAEKTEEKPAEKTETKHAAAHEPKAEGQVKKAADHHPDQLKKPDEARRRRNDAAHSTANRNDRVHDVRKEHGSSRSKESHKDGSHERTWTF